MIMKISNKCRFFLQCDKYNNFDEALIQPFQCSFENRDLSVIGKMKKM